jgi:nucleotide-binding universal stress UspA family protein
MFKHILVPVDFSEQSKLIRPHVLSMARHCQARITLLHVIPLPAVWYGGAEGGYGVMFDVPGMESAARKELSTFLDAPADEDKSEYNVDVAVETGEPADRITAYAAKHDVDLIMMPTHGFGVFRSLLLGSIVAKVLHDAKCSVWTAAHVNNLPPAANPTCGGKMLCAIDFAPSSAVLVRRACEFAKLFCARLTLLHAVPMITSSEAGADIGLRRTLMQAARESLANLQHQTATSLDALVEEGSIANTVRNATEHGDIRLLIIGRGHMNQALGRLRSSTYQIIRSSRCPVLSL